MLPDPDRLTAVRSLTITRYRIGFRDLTVVPGFVSSVSTESETSLVSFGSTLSSASMVSDSASPCSIVTSPDPARSIPVNPLT